MKYSCALKGSSSSSGIMRREVPSDRLRKAAGSLRKPAGWLDRHTGERLTFLVSPPFDRVTYLGGRYRLDLTAASGDALVTQSATRLQPGDQIGLALSAPWAFAAA